MRLLRRGLNRPPDPGPGDLDALANRAGTTGPGTDSLEQVLFPRGLPDTVEGRAELLELYKIMVQSSESLVTRRQGTNTFFLTANGLLLSSLGLVLRPGNDPRRIGTVVVFLCLTGLITSWAWRSLLISFGQLNKGKFAVILRLEKALAAALFDAEWESLGRGENDRVYRSFTTTESRIPRTLMVIYSIAGVIALLSALGWLPHI